MHPSCFLRSTFEAATKILCSVVSMRGGLCLGSTGCLFFQSWWITTTGSVFPSRWSDVNLLMSGDPSSYCSEVPMPSARSKIRQRFGLTSCAANIYFVFFSLSLIFLIPLVLIKNLGLGGIGIIVPINTMSPSKPHLPVSSPQEHVLLLKLSIIS